MNGIVAEPQDIADLLELSGRLYLTFLIILLICRQEFEFDSDIGPGPFDLETR